MRIGAGMRAAIGATLALFLAIPAAAQENENPHWDSTTVFALLHGGEWCAGPTIHVDLWNGEYVLHPRLSPPQCYDRELRRETEHRILNDTQLAALRAVTHRAMEAGLEGDDRECIYVSNGGPRVMVIAGPQYNLITKGQGCWSAEADELKDVLREIIEAPREAAPADDLQGRREVPQPE